MAGKLLHLFRIEMIRALLLQMVYNKQVIKSGTVIWPALSTLGRSSCEKAEEIRGSDCSGTA